LKSYQSVDVENGLAWAIWTSEARYGQNKGRESNCKNWPDPGVRRWSAKHSWKEL
jgi:hypothetical protein